MRQLVPAEMTLTSAAECTDFEAFFERNVERARRLAWRLVGGDEAAAADVVQEAFVKAYRGLDAFRAEATLDSWFYRIVINEAASYRRRGWFKRWIGSSAGASDGEAVEPDALASAQPRPDASDPPLRRRISAALDSLSRGQREAFVLVHLEGHTAREAALAMGVAEGSVKRHLHRALVRLRRELETLREE